MTTVDSRLYVRLVFMVTESGKESKRERDRARETDEKGKGKKQHTKKERGFDLFCHVHFL